MDNPVCISGKELAAGVNKPRKVSVSRLIFQLKSLPHLAHRPSLLFKTPSVPLISAAPAVAGAERVPGSTAPARAPSPAVDIAIANNNNMKPALGLEALGNDVQSSCNIAVLAIFPNICRNYLERVSRELAFDYEAIVRHIVENGIPYPTQSLQQGILQSGNVNAAVNGRGNAPAANDDDGAKAEAMAIRKFGTNNQQKKQKSPLYMKLSRVLFAQAFVYVPTPVIVDCLHRNGNCLLPSMLDMDTQIADKSPHELPFDLKKDRTKLLPEYAPERLFRTSMFATDQYKKEALGEYRKALDLLRLRKERRRVKKERQLAELAEKERQEKENFRQAQLYGATKECECCFGEFAMNRMVHCDGSIFHWFCIECARRMAENLIGLSRHNMSCMSMDGCEADFSSDQRMQFLDEKMTMALGRIEQDHYVRMAGIENLETCPFCPFAAEFPPVEENREFPCQNPDCGQLSCRLCRKNAHSPKTCEEAEHETSTRLQIEEARSLALIRKCNNCGTPFIKEQGCNKMTCSRPGCGSVQCYVCHKSCDYSHFDDAARGGQRGNCPLFDNLEERHAREVDEAEQAVRREVAAKNPDGEGSLLD